MAQTTHVKDPLRDIVGALPPEWRASRSDLRAFLRRYGELNLDWLTKPISSAECAALLGKTPGALRVMRSRGLGPSGFTAIEGLGWVYPSRLHVLLWVADQVEQAALEPSKRMAA